MREFRLKAAPALALIFVMGCVSPELRTARIAINEKDYDRALAAVERELIRDPGSEDALFLAGYCHEVKGNWSKMTMYYDKTIAAGVNYSAKIKESRTRITARYFGKADAAFDSAQALETAGAIEGEIQQQWTLSLQNLDTALTVSPGELSLLRQGAVTSFYAERYDPAIDFALKTIAKETAEDWDSGIREILIAIYTTREDNPNAVKWGRDLMTKLGKPGPDNTQTYLRALDAVVVGSVAMGNEKDAEMATKEALTLFPNNEALKLNVAIIHIKSGDLTAAEAIFHDILKVNPDQFESNLNLGTILVNRDEWTNAIPFLERAHKSDPTNRVAVQNLMAAYFNSDQAVKGAEMKKKLDAILGK